MVVLAAFPANLYNDGEANVAAMACMAMALVLSTWPSCTNTCRHLYSCSWISIFTGHTLLHEPQSVDAKGNELCFLRSIPGESIEPIGPGTTLSYEYPPLLR